MSSLFQNIQTQSGAYALLDSLVRHGVQHIFGYPGGAILPIYDELYFWEQIGLIQHILVRHEQGAAHAADAYARATGKVGVCFATSGPGATNLVSGIATAHLDSVPLVAITGQVGRSFIGTDAFQEVDIFGITLPIVKHSYVLRDPRDISRIIAEAFYIAQDGRPGPVLVDIPKDVGLEEFIYMPVMPGKVNLPGCRPIRDISSRQILNAVALIKKSRQPLLYVGGGAIISNSYDEISELASDFYIPVTTTLMGKGAFDETNPLSLGMLGMHGTAYANFAVSECDLLIALGARFDDRVTGKLDEFACNAQVIHVDIDPAEVGKNRVPQVALVGDMKEVLKRILFYLKQDLFGGQDSPKDKTETWLKRLFQWRQDYPLLVPSNESSLSPQEVISQINLCAPDAFYSTDVGQHQMWSAQFLTVKHRRWLSSAGLGTMGYGLPAAIGAQIAHPREQVICISGDSSFQMNLQELATISQYNLGIKIIIINNQWQGMVRQWQEAFYQSRYSHSNMSNGSPDFSRLAEAFGIRGVKIQSKKEIQDLLPNLLSSQESILIDFQVIENENCYPMVAPGKSNAQMLGIESIPSDLTSMQNK
uniref:acetohydroxyacid synthase large subunit n=1 Tax=Tsunamia transpacifica TaxID=1935457 RepID=UPI001BF053CF|nr:acetohydroxyacid synthase large subunit [Tsunamia transpacifica]QUE27844.1 IlvB [Tsunamia transpacifica]UNJ14359.1 acetohydroxyacid synthase large subunit [Tsunamia transpacifica]